MLRQMQYLKTVPQGDEAKWLDVEVAISKERGNPKHRNQISASFGSI